MGWIRRFIFFHKLRHPKEMDGGEVNAFLTYLAVDRKISASTQNQALAALLFLYREVLGGKLEELGHVIRAPRRKRVPVVLTRDEVSGVLGKLDGIPRLVATLLYGTGMRLMECLRLRIKDVDLDRREIVVRSAKGGNEGITLMPLSLEDQLRAQVGTARKVHRRDIAAGYGYVALPNALDRKYRTASRDWWWQLPFPASREGR